MNESEKAIRNALAAFDNADGWREENAATEDLAWHCSPTAITKLLAELDALRKDAAVWQPIETAPTGCDQVLALTTDKSIKIVAGIHLHRLIFSARQQGDECYYTHWMPLPKTADH